MFRTPSRMATDMAAVGRMSVVEAATTTGIAKYSGLQDTCRACEIVIQWQR